MRLGTRGSDLALWQARHIAERLHAAGHEVELAVYSTRGDRLLDRPLAEIGEKGLFTDELDRALVAGDIQLAVHSLKDLPTVLPEEVALAAVSSREDPRDAFVAHPEFSGSLTDLPEGATVATSSLRRRALLLALRPDLQIVPVRGNVPTRIHKLDGSGEPGRGGWHGLILAAAGLKRLGLEERITELVEPDVMLPAVGQGALAVVAARQDQGTIALLEATVADYDATVSTAAERALLRRLEGGCQVPIAAHAELADQNVRLTAAVVSLDGSRLVRDTFSGPAARPDTLGVALAEHLLADGADQILAAIRATE